MYKKMVLIGCIFISILHAKSIMANEDGGMGYFMFGTTQIKINELNKMLKDNGYPECEENLTSFGGGGHGIIKDKVIIGGEGHGLIGRESSNDTYKIRIVGGYGVFNLGYILYSTKNLRLYPIFGIGGGGLSLKIIEKKEDLSFRDVLENPKRGVELSTGGFLVNLAIGGDYLLRLGKDERGEGGLVFGIRTGYILPHFEKWEMDEIDISHGPRIGVTGPYIRIMIGGGGFYTD